MAANDTFNLYSAENVADGHLPSTERIYLTTVSTSPWPSKLRPYLRVWVHYWLDRDDKDTQNAVKLDMVGDQALVHAIDRGIRHLSRLLGILSNKTRDSWWITLRDRCLSSLGSFTPLPSAGRSSRDGCVTRVRTYCGKLLVC